MTATGEKTGGRQKGTPNKTTSEIRTKLQGFVSEQLDNIHVDFELLTPNDKLMFLAKLLPYVASKQMPVDDEEEAEEYKNGRSNKQRLMMFEAMAEMRTKMEKEGEVNEELLALLHPDSDGWIQAYIPEEHKHKFK